MESTSPLPPPLPESLPEAEPAQEPLPKTEPPQETEAGPEPKKLKMSTTTSDDDEEPTIITNPSSLTDRKPRYKRRKIAIFLAYCGVGYQGMQKNPGAKTIEADLEEALYHAGGVPEHDRGKPKRFDWARSARTDKGVSAVGQVVSGRFYVDPPGFVDRLNSFLPDQIRIFGFKRVTSSFSAKKFCDKRRYVYLIPVFALDRNSHPNRESVLASLGSENELVKCLECPERGRKVAGAMGKPGSRSKMVGNDNQVVVEIELESAVEVGDEKLVQCSNAVAQEMELESRVEVEEEKVEKCINGSGFCYGEKEKEKFNGILSHFLGTHNFHNFTTRIKAEDPSSTRYIISFEANTVVTVDGMDFIKCEIVGQSFMLHQIRKLIGLAVAIMRDCAPASLIDHALRKDINITVPTAPEVGLYLDECFFTSYNQKWKDTHEEISMEDFAVQAEDFKMKQVYSHIASMEKKEGSVSVWLHSLNHRNYPDLRFVEDNGASVNGGNLQVESTEQVMVEADGVFFFQGGDVVVLTLGLVVTGNEDTMDINITVPTAPEVGLYLDECFFTSYNQKWKDTHEEISMEDFAVQAEDFKMKQVYSHIASMEKKEGSVSVWLHSLNHRNYPDLRFVEDNGASVNGGNLQVESTEQVMVEVSSA